MNRLARRPFLTSLIGGVSSLPLAAQQAPSRPPGESYAPKQSDRPELLTGDAPGFTIIFDGKMLTSWGGDPQYWPVADGVMIGEISSSGFRIEGGLPDQSRWQQRDQLSQLCGPGPSNARKYVCHPRADESRVPKLAVAENL